jgi:Ca2+/Na+ antiporter
LSGLELWIELLVGVRARDITAHIPATGGQSIEMNFKLTEASFSEFKQRFFVRTVILFLLPVLFIGYSSLSNLNNGTFLFLVVYLLLIFFLAVKSRQYFDKSMRNKKSFQITLHDHEIIQSQVDTETICIPKEDVVQIVEYTGNSGCVISRNGKKIIFPNTIESYGTLMASLAEWQPVEETGLKFYQSQSGLNMMIILGFVDVTLLVNSRNLAVKVIASLPIFAYLIFAVYYYWIRNGGENRKKCNPIFIILAWLGTLAFMWMSWGSSLLHP